MKPQTRSHYATVVQRTIERISGHLDEALDLETLAREACNPGARAGVRAGIGLEA
jgi:hypothetical protein